MQKIVLATSNPHKVEEINSITKGLGIEFILPPKDFDPFEDGKTFEQNAVIKAQEAYNLTGLPSLADDSGLCVDALNGEPGIHSARYAETAQARIEKLLNALKGVPEDKRGAKFVCAMAFLDGEGNVAFLDRGECFGRISHEKKGVNGFGYDPVFLVGNGNESMAELSEESKNLISHRGIALQKFIQFLKTSNIIF